MGKRVVALIAAVALGAVVLQCTSGPKPPCQNGSVKVTYDGKETHRFHCHDGEWVKQ